MVSIEITPSLQDLLSTIRENRAAAIKSDDGHVAERARLEWFSSTSALVDYLDSAIELADKA